MIGPAPVPVANSAVPAVAPPPPTRPGRGRRLAALVADTPGRLSAISTLSVAVLLGFGILGAAAVGARISALADARAQADQLVRLQAVHTNLVQADAAATNSYLAGGIEAPEQRERYRAAVATASRQLAAAVHAGGEGEMAELAAANDAVTRYAGRIEAARVYNRQGLPLGAAYLRQGSDQLHRDVLPVVSWARDTTDLRTYDAYNSFELAALPLIAAALAALAVLAGGQLWLARRVHRYLNVPLVAATAALVLASVVALAAMNWAQDRAEGVQIGSAAATGYLTRARIAAYDAKSTESLTLILQGAGGGDDEWRALADEATRQLAMARISGAGSLDEPFAAWRQVHDAIEAADRGGNWPGAVALATGTGDGSSNQVFDAFADASQIELDAQVARTREGLDSPRPILIAAQVLVFLAGVAAAVAAWYGYAQRLEEYR